MSEPGLVIGKTPDGASVGILPAMANRHGLIAGATGTGKTVTLQVLAEAFSRIGTSVFMADVKGDLSGLAAPSAGGERISARVAQLGLPFTPAQRPTVFWDLYGENGHALRTSVSEMGPLLLSTIMGLNDTQTACLYAAFKIADDEGLLLLDLKDLRALIAHVSGAAKSLQAQYGNLAPASLAAIQRGLLVLEEEGAEEFFGEPSLALPDLMLRDFSGGGVISVLDARRLMTKPRLYAAFLLWLLSELFEQLPEVGDLDKPKLVFFFDEAHLLFDNAPKPLLEKVQQVVRLIRSKGVGVYFITQNPLDVPQDVLGQLSHRVQHALRAFTPQDQRAVRAVADTFRASPGLDVEKAVMELAVGEALVSVLDEKGTPTPVARTLIRPPESRIGALSDPERKEALSRSPLAGRYDKEIDRESAYEMLNKRASAPPPPVTREIPRAPPPAPRSQSPVPRTPRPAPRGRQREGIGEAMAKSAARAVGSSLGRQIIRGVLGNLLGGR